MGYTPGPGDERTWGPCAGHPNDPRTELDIEDDGDGFSDMTGDELVEFAKQADNDRAMLLAALKVMTQTFIDGEHYKTCNPYLRPYVKQALIAIGKTEGKSVFGYDWCDALKERT